MSRQCQGVPGVNLRRVSADELRRSLLRIGDPSDLDRLPYGTIIIAGAEEEPGIYTLMKIDQGLWRTVAVYGNPSTVYQIEEEEEYTPALPALLVLCGEELPEERPVQRNFVLLRGGADDEKT